VPHESGYAPVRFAAHCARCHSERLDDELPDLAVPHGQQPDQLREWVTAAYLRRMVADGSIAKREGLGSSDTPDWAETLARRSETALRALLEPGRKRGCLVCHTLEEGRIRPPEVPARWLSKARFDHRPHASQRCAACHEIETSDSSMDLRLPGIANCRDCHRAGGASRRCVACHDYHQRR
jgi:predicted CXXCH cytochrome family protein